MTVKKVMLKTNLEAKGVKRSSGHEGEGLLAGNIYLNNKKVGYMVERDYGAGFDYSIEPRYQQEVQQETQKMFQQFPNKYGYNHELELYELLVIKSLEMDFKRSTQKKAFYKVEAKTNLYIADFFLTGYVEPTLDMLINYGIIKPDKVNEIAGVTVYALSPSTKKVVKIGYKF